jgi:hypothetical protein
MVYNLALSILGNQQIIVGFNPYTALGEFRHPIIVSNSFSMERVNFIFDR